MGKTTNKIRSAQRQDGVVLLICLILLLVTTFIGYSVMETSSLESKMVASKLAKEESFQAAESVLQMALANPDNITEAYASANSGGGAVTKPETINSDSELTAELTTTYIGDALAIGSDITVGGKGRRNQFFEMRSTVTRGADSFESQHVQGIRRQVPNL